MVQMHCRLSYFHRKYLSFQSVITRLGDRGFDLPFEGAMDRRQKRGTEAEKKVKNPRTKDVGLKIE
jgi:hypothetical protein